MYHRALISVFNKQGLAAFLKPLVQQGLELVSTGGTGEFLKSKNFKVTDVKDITGFPELLSGRVKTLHPHIHISLLAREWKKQDQEVLKDRKLQAFDLVIGNLYPFENQALDELQDKELVEWIDVGGPSFLRAAAKNYFSITTLCDVNDYSLAQKGTSLTQRKFLAGKVFQKLSTYDACIAKHFMNVKKDEQTKELAVKATFFKTLRYGENPHQKACWYKKDQEGLHDADILQGKALSYNNLLDFSAACLTLRDLDSTPAVVAVKHNNPCGVATGSCIQEATQRALQADPISVFGGLIALNQPVDKITAQHLTSIFLEGVIAPDFSQEALTCFKTKKNLRVLKWKNLLTASLPLQQVSEVIGGMLVQTRDSIDQVKNWEFLRETPCEQVQKDLLFAWKICAHLKSNAIAVVKDNQSIGLAMGQVNRIDAVHQALHRAKTLHPQFKTNLILASDAFFPFPDAIELAAKFGVSWIIQPGGSIKDKSIFKLAQKLGLNMILTGKRHFKH